MNLIQLLRAQARALGRAANQMGSTDPLQLAVIAVAMGFEAEADVLEAEYRQQMWPGKVWEALDADS